MRTALQNHRARLRRAHKLGQAADKANATRATRPVLTYELAHSIAWDETNRRMRKEGRTVWTSDDYQDAMELLDRILAPKDF